MLLTHVRLGCPLVPRADAVDTDVMLRKLGACLPNKPEHGMFGTDICD
jgi:hypothetical protein